MAAFIHMKADADPKYRPIPANVFKCNQGRNLRHDAQEVRGGRHRDKRVDRPSFGVPWGQR